MSARAILLLFFLNFFVNYFHQPLQVAKGSLQVGKRYLEGRQNVPEFPR